jgi:hypothetical protein
MTTVTAFARLTTQTSVARPSLVNDAVSFPLDTAAETGKASAEVFCRLFAIIFSIAARSLPSAWIAAVDYNLRGINLAVRAQL